ncbi:alpha/beta hydrolase [Hymenobacter busanensis]|uniref:Alpha/beta hydrolase n=1 Tax=Hymenobacter busanensis TaxID=2607656 RepID=A0A7L4ZSX0_9BACT|nr:alpha/beta fold hydrolase [Hymenobacter busanensis]KAA9327633.1 alpha/beta hydrolase [Hymenobacter busanensis]QHJ06027.1 alpha/beta fold hydrolase [Hymenobacter busanensis]
MQNTFSPAYQWMARHEPLPAAPMPFRYAAPPGIGLVRLKFRLLAAVSTEWAFREAWRLFCTPRRLPRKKWEDAALATAQAFRVPFEGGTLAAYEWNPQGQRTVLLVHGWEHRASFWGVFADGLVRAGYRVVAFDAPAHGDSSGRLTTLPEFGRATQAVADHVATTGAAVYAVVAHSFGAATTAGLPVLFNQGQGLARLVLMSAPSSTPDVARRFADLLRLPDAVVARMLRHVREQSGRDAESFSLTQAAGKVRADRVLLLHDCQDESVPFADAQAVVRSWPGLEFHPTTGLGHNKIMRDQGVIRQVAEFLR